MFFSLPYRQRRRSDKLVQYLLGPICKECNYNLIRADKIKSNDQIDETIINHLNSANIIIVDITGFNPNVFFELGYSVAINSKKVIQISDASVKEIPFDRITTRTFRYNFDISNTEKFKSDIIDVIKNIEKTNDIQQSLIENNDEDTFNSIVLSYLEKLDQSYKLIEDLSIRTHNTAMKISHQLSSDTVDKNSFNGITEKLIEVLLQNPESFKVLLSSIDKSKSNKNDYSEALTAF